MSIREDVRTQRRVACSMYLGRRGGGVLCCTATFPPRRNLHLNQEDGGRGRTNSKTNEALASSSLSPLLPSLPSLPQSPCNKSTSFPSFIHRNMIFALAASLTDCTDEREREREEREKERGRLSSVRGKNWGESKKAAHLDFAAAAAASSAAVISGLPKSCDGRTSGVRAR